MLLRQASMNGAPLRCALSALSGVLGVGCALLGSAAWAQQPGDPSLPQPPVYGQPEQPYVPPQQPPPDAQQPQYAPQQPQYAPQQPQYAPQQPQYAPPPAYPPARRFGYFRPQFGLGLRGQGLWSGNAFTGFGQGGVGLDLLARLHPRLTMELGFQYQRTSQDSYNQLYSNYYDRMDIPMTLGLRIHLGHPFWPLSPYLVVAGGADYGRAYVPDASYSLIQEEAWFLEGQFGGGVELRVGRHFAMTLDLRGVGRLRLDKGSQLVALDATGASVPVMGNQGGLAFNAGLLAFF